MDNLRRKLDSLLSDYQHAKRSVKEEKKALKDAREHLQHCLTAQKLVQGVAEEVQKEAYARISSLVTRCLQSVFAENAYEFRIDFVQKRGKTEANLILSRDGMDLEDPINEAGGGVLDVAAFALRLTALLLSMPPKRRVLLLDEPMKHLNGQVYQDRVGEMLETLSRELGVQLIIVTDDDWLKIGKVIKL